MSLELLYQDAYLNPYREAIDHRINRFNQKLSELTNHTGNLKQFAIGHLYYGLIKNGDHWTIREWAPNAKEVYLVGDFSSWEKRAEFALKRLDSQGNWELILPLKALRHGMSYTLHLDWQGGQGDRLPAYVNYVVQDPKTERFAAQIWDPREPYEPKHSRFVRRNEPLIIYEAHVGMAQDEEKVGTYLEFRDKVLPRIVGAGYNAIQLMAIKEHPYYGSFGYQVSNFFAPSSRFGTPCELKALIDACHENQIAVIMDMVHSHAVRNEVEGISRQDGTLYQYFHEGDRGFHPAWDSRCFDYGKNEVIHFLLSNCAYWLTAYNIDGFRFDGVTSMLYHDHGHRAFDHYDHYFNDGVDHDACTYLSLANRLIHDIKPGAITVAEDMSGMPGTCISPEDGGLGFDYRLAMGMPDLWIKLIKHIRDEDWNVKDIWHELTDRRVEAKTIAYCESHDQALVGDKTIIFRLIDKEMYWHMKRDSANLAVDRGIALHKLIKLITFTAGGDGYLNFMGNEFGHPQWIDFPREGNGFSYHFAMRQWNLVDNPELIYRKMAKFDHDMVHYCKDILLDHYAYYITSHEKDQVIAYSRGNLVFVFNFNPSKSFTNYGINVPKGQYQLLFSTDDEDYWGHGRLERMQHIPWNGCDGDANNMGRIYLYLPTRTALIIERRQSYLQ